MANAYSHLHNYAQDLYTPHFDLIGQVLQYKQGKLDTNRAKLQDLNDRMAMADVAKDEDKEYLNQRLSKAVDIANQYAGLDLSNDGLANDLIGKLTSVVDENVKNAVVGTKTLRSEQAAWAKLEEDSPELFNAGNKRFAMQGANQWLNDGKVGKAYNGGGGVIAYDDYQKRWLEAIPDISEALGDNYEYIASEQGVGIFIDKVTKRAVDRGTMSGLMDNILGPKGKQQQAIDAWNIYDGAEPELLKAEYNSWWSPQVEEADRRITHLKGMISKSSGDKQKMYQQSLDNWTSTKGSLNEVNFDKLASRGPKGLQSAYQTMFSARAKEPWLKGYSYDEKVVKREVDQNHVKSLELKEQIRHHLEMEANAKNAKNAKSSSNTIQQFDENGNPTIIRSGEGFVDSSGELVSEMTVSQKNQYKGYQAAKAVFGNLSGAELVDIGMQLDGIDLSQDEITVKVRGKDKVVRLVKDGASTAEGLNILSFLNNSVHDTKFEVDKKNNIRKGIQDLGDKLSYEYYLNTGIVSASPFLNSKKGGFNKRIKLVSGEGEEPRYAVAEWGEGENYDTLLKRVGDGNVSTEDQLTLDYVMYSSFIGDPSVDKQVSREAFVTMREDFVEAIGWEEFNKLPKSAKEIRSNFISYNSESSTALDALGIYAPVVGPVSTWAKAASYIGDMFTNDKKNLSDLGFEDSESYNGVTVSGMVSDLSSKIKGEGATEAVVTPVKWSVASTDSRYKRLVEEIEAQTGFTPKGSIQLSAEATPGADKFSGNVHYYFNTKDGHVESADSKALKGKDIDGKKFEPLNGAVLDQIGIPIVSEQRSMYNPSMGAKAPKLNLGSSAMDSRQLERVSTDLAYRNESLTLYEEGAVENILDLAKQVSVEKELEASQELEAFFNGEYEFKIESNNTDYTYHIIMSKGGEEIDRLAMPEFNSREISNFMALDAHKYKHKIFNDYLQHKIFRSEAQGVLSKRKQAAIEEIQSRNQ